MEWRKCAYAGVEEFGEHFRERRLLSLTGSGRKGDSWAIGDVRADYYVGLEEVERDERLCLKLVGLEGLEKARTERMKRGINGDTREWLPLFDCCYRGCMKKGMVVWRWRWKRLFFCTKCAADCEDEHRMELKFKSYTLGKTSIWGLDWNKEEDCVWMRSNAKLQADLGLKNDDDLWL